MPRAAQNAPEWPATRTARTARFLIVLDGDHGSRQARAMDERLRGRYTLRDAAAIVGLPTATVKRWLGVSGAATVVRHPATPTNLVSFLDLAELDIVRRLVDSGMDIRKLRAATQDAGARLDTTHPLAQKRFLVHGDTLFYQAVDHLLQLGSGGQLAFEQMIRDRAAVYDFASDGYTQRIWPMGRGSVVVIDPSHVGGAPSITGTRWTTWAIANAVRNEGGAEAVARLYGLDVERVRAAVDYEERQRAA